MTYQFRRAAYAALEAPDLTTHDEVSFQVGPLTFRITAGDLRQMLREDRQVRRARKGARASA